MTRFAYTVVYSGTLEADDEDAAIEAAYDVVEFEGTPDSCEVEAIPDERD